MKINTVIINFFSNKCKKRKKFKWYPSEVFFIVNNKIKGQIMTTTAKVGQEFNVTWPAPKDKFGNDAKVQDGSVVFVSDDDTITSIVATPENGAYSAKVTTHGIVGSTMVRIKADANLNDDGDPTTTDDVKTIEGTLTVEVLSGDAVAFGDPTATTPIDTP